MKSGLYFGSGCMNARVLSFIIQGKRQPLRCSVMACAVRSLSLSLSLCVCMYVCVCVYIYIYI